MIKLNHLSLVHQSPVYRCLLSLMVCFLFCGTAAKADYGYSYLTKYDKFNPVTVFDLRQLEDAIKSKATAIRISQGADPAVVTVKDLERLGKSVPLQCLVVDSFAIEYQDGRYLRFMPKLEVLKMKRCRPEVIGFIPRTAPLKQIRCEEKFDSRCLPNLGKLTQLEYLSLRSCKISDEDLKFLQTLTNLKVLDLCGTNITGSGLKYLAKCSQLKYLDLSHNQHLDAVALVNMKYFPDLRSLEITETSIGDAAFKYVAQLRKLESIMFGDTKVTDRGMAAFSNLSELREVTFWRDNVTDAGMQYLANCKKLVSIYVSDCPITDKAMTYLVALPKLSDLSLEATKITDKSLPLFIKMPALEDLNVDKTAFSTVAWAELKRHKKKKEKQKQILVPGALGRTPILCGNSIVLGLYPSGVICLDKLNGRQLWSLKRDPHFMSPFKTNVVCVDYSPQLKITALRADTGQAIWSYTDSQFQGQANVDYTYAIKTEIDAGHLFLFFGSGRALCLDLNNGKVLWDKTYSGISFGNDYGQNYPVGQDSTKFYLKAFTGTWRENNGKSFVIALSKTLGNVVWRSRPLFMKVDELLIEPHMQANCLLVVAISKPLREDNDEPPYVFVLDKNTGHLLKIGNMPRIKLLPRQYLKAKDHLCLEQGYLFYIEQVDAGKNTGRFCSLQVERIPSNKVVFDIVKSSVFLYPRFDQLTKEGLLVHGNEASILLNTKDLKTGFKLKQEPPQFLKEIMAITRIKNENQAVLSIYRSKKPGNSYCIADSTAQIASFRVPDGKRLFTLLPAGIGKYVYDNDSKQLFMDDDSGKFSCWNLKTAKQRWIFSMPLRPIDPPHMCGMMSDYLRHSLSH